jgi:tRNA threonylcarbamoyladenosine biosynthesis protein TsaE
MIWETSSTSSADTERLGELLGKQLKGGEVIELRSDLGGGKTTFAKGLARGAGSHGVVTSPTFTLSRVYRSPKFTINHFDFYRLNDAGILADQLAESVSNRQAVTIVEWAEIVEEVLPDKRISVELQPTSSSSEERRISFNYPQDSLKTLAAIQTAWQAVEP